MEANMKEKAPQICSKSIQVQSNQLPIIRQISLLQAFTEQTLRKLKNLELTLEQMSFQSLKNYQAGLKQYQPKLKYHIKLIRYTMRSRGQEQRFQKEIQKIEQKPREETFFQCLSASVFGILSTLKKRYTKSTKRSIQAQDLKNGYLSISLQDQPNKQQSEKDGLKLFQTNKNE